MGCNVTLCDVDCPGRVDRELYARQRRCWMCAYYEDGTCHALPPVTQLKKGEAMSSRPEVNLFDLACSMYVRGDYTFKSYSTDAEVH